MSHNPPSEHARYEYSDRSDVGADTGLSESPADMSHPELGDCRAAFRANITRNASWLMSLLTGVVVFGGLLGYMIHQDGLRPKDQGLAIGQLIMAALAVMCAVLLIRAVRNASGDLLLFEKGLIARRGKKLEQLRWDDVETIFEEVRVTTYDHGAATHIKHKLRFCLGDQRQMQLDLSAFLESEQISAAVADATLPRLLRDAQARLATGQLVEFGFVNLSGAGLERPGDVSGKAALGWRDVAEFTLDNGLLTIKSLRGWKPWAWKAVEDIPNLRVLIALLERNTSDALQPCSEAKNREPDLTAP
jgi:hypothetical protein